MSDIIATAPITHPETEHGHAVPMDPNEIKPKWHLSWFADGTAAQRPIR